MRVNEAGLRMRVKVRLVVCICARTTTRILRDADQEHKEHHPAVRRQTNRRMLVYCFALSLCVRECALSAPCRVSANECVYTSARVVTGSTFRYLKLRDLQLCLTQ